MSNYLDIEDNIVALATAQGLGSIDIVRISGKSLMSLYQKLSRKNSTPPPNSITKHEIYSSIDDSLLDTCLLAFFAAPKSFTGQDVLEINCHGGGHIANKIIQSLCSLGGVRLALPGEFLFRAYVNNKVDLIQAEAINSMISSESSTYNQKTLENIDGKLSDKVLIIKKLITNLLLTIEHELDFDESEILHISNQKIAKKTKEIIKHIESVTLCYFFSKTVCSGLRVLLLGRPNVGKSSIYNYLLGINRSIVADVPGTTRDTIETSLEIEGHRVVLIDSAGSRRAINKIENLGVEKTKEETGRADLILLVGEKNSDIDAFKDIINDKPCIKIWSKNDIYNHKKGLLSISTENGHGFKQLSTELSTKIKDYYKRNHVHNEFLINERQYNILINCNNQLKSLIKDIDGGVPRDITADLLHVILDEYNNIINPVDRDDIINNIFAGFCIGK